MTAVTLGPLDIPQDFLSCLMPDYESSVFTMSQMEMMHHKAPRKGKEERGGIKNINAQDPRPRLLLSSASAPPLRLLLSACSSPFPLQFVFLLLLSLFVCSTSISAPFLLLLWSFTAPHLLLLLSSAPRVTTGTRTRSLALGRTVVRSFGSLQPPSHLLLLLFSCYFPARLLLRISSCSSSPATFLLVFSFESPPAPLLLLLSCSSANSAPPAFPLRFCFGLLLVAALSHLASTLSPVSEVVIHLSYFPP
jgi:hypothetical protein